MLICKKRCGEECIYFSLHNYMGNSKLKFHQNSCFFQLWACTLTTCYQIKFGYIANPLDKGLFITMQNHFLVAITNSEQKERDLRDIFCQKMSRRSRSFFSELVNATKKGFAWW